MAATTIYKFDMPSKSGKNLTNGANVAIGTGADQAGALAAVQAASDAAGGNVDWTDATATLLTQSDNLCYLLAHVKA